MFDTLNFFDLELKKNLKAIRVSIQARWGSKHVVLCYCCFFKERGYLMALHANMQPRRAFSFVPL